MIDTTKYVVINRRNYRQYAAQQGGVYPRQALVDVLQGTTGYKGWQSPDKPHEFSAPAPLMAAIPRSEWPGLITIDSGMRAINALIAQNVQAKYQNGLNYCWCYGSTRAVEARKLVLGMNHVELSPESIGGPCTNWRNVGGFASEAFAQIETGGICEASFMDAPHSLRPSRWQTGWEANAKLHTVIKWYEIGSNFDDTYTCLLNNLPVAAGLDWWGHLICYVAPVMFPDGTFGVLAQNSWGDWPRKGDNGYFILTEDMATSDGAAAPVLTGDDVTAV